MKTERIDKLRETYMNTPMVTKYARDLYCYYIKVGANLFLYTEGWKRGIDCVTLMQRHAFAESYVLKNTRPRIYKGELITGSLDLDVDEIYSKAQQEQLKKEYFELIPKKPSRESHMALDYEKLLEYGIDGIIKEIDGKLDSLDITDTESIEKIEFYTCLKEELEGVLKLEESYMHEALRLHGETGDNDYLELARLLENVPKKPASTFKEALQSVHFFTFNLCGLYSMGKVDDYLYPYYKRDIESGILTDDLAQELIDCFCLLFIPNVMQWTSAGFMLGGTDKNGDHIENPLTKMFLTAIEHTSIPDPNVGLCINESTGDDILKYASYLIGEGYTNPAVWNDRKVISCLTNNGVLQEHAYCYTNSTCVELTPIGCSGISVTSPYVNLLQVFLDAFYKANENVTYPELLSLFENELYQFLKKAVYNENLGLLENRRNAHTNPIRSSALVKGCIESGRSIAQGGALYYGLMADFLGFSNVVESFNVLNQLVFTDKAISFADIRNAVKDNFENTDILEKIEEKVGHFGNDEESSNSIAKEVSDIVFKVAAKFKCINASTLKVGAFSYNNHIPYGNETGASPDGRRNGEPLNNGSNPARQYDINGPTAMLNSLNSLTPNRFMGGFTVNVNLPKTVKDSIYYLLKSFICLDIPQLQFNVLDKSELLKAQTDPEKYKNLIVRVGGYSDYFINLTPELQHEVISRYK
jgi:formate C-acetyltransferase